MKKITLEEASNVLNAWAALEILSPQSFRKPEDLAAGENSSVALFNDGILPWENGGEEVSPDRELFYQIIIGTIDLDSAFSALSKKYGEPSTLEQISIPPKAVMAVAVVDQHGYPSSNPLSFAISSFPWGVSQALKGNLNLHSWPEIEKKTIKIFFELLSPRNKNGEYLPLSKAVIDEACDYLVKTFDIPQQIIARDKNEKFAIRFYIRKKSDESKKTENSEKLPKEKFKSLSENKIEPPSALLLNSFFLDDLFKAQIQILINHPSNNLLKYLGVNVPNNRYNILNENDALKEALAPKNIPLARWPSGKRSLVMLQQTAVNLTSTELKQGGILAINGPPGTGKTTLLRDIVAKLIAERAEALSAFDDPVAAFSPQNKIKIGQWWAKPHSLNSSIKGFELLVASSNNKAVENISAELPNINAMENSEHDFRYFSALSDKLSNDKTWGLISAVLGNSSNRNFFRDIFWWNKDFGFGTYLEEASGKPQTIEVKDKKSGKILKRIPKIIEENNPPRSYAEAIDSWQQARSKFKAAVQESKLRLNALQKIKILNDKLTLLRNKFIYINYSPAFLVNNWKLKPNIFWHIIDAPHFRRWRKEFEDLCHDNALRRRCLNIEAHLARISRSFDQSHFINDALLSKCDNERQKITPWCDEATQRIREKVFIAAMALHKAFIDAAAVPIRHNLMLLMQNFCGSQVEKDIEIYMPDLWSTFFLVIPCASTTFSSVGRMLKTLPANTFGWLLIDEAGQALPQAAVGAIMRAKNIVVTGDPLQIEPVVMLPKKLTKNICAEFKVDTNIFNAPEASVQTLADAATSYYSKFEGKYGSRYIGLPLLVHRRCTEPMFSISNTIAYQGRMVHEKKITDSPIRNCIGPSFWFDIHGAGQDKWCPEEGKKVLELLYMLKKSGIAPNLYVISPFRIVANNLRKIINDSRILNNWVNKSDCWAVQHIGTVHTVQGREDEAVILVLGAPMAEQNGARTWVGKNPNILNVAVTRAKEVIYVVGNKSLWRNVGVFEELHERIR